MVVFCEKDKIRFLIQKNLFGSDPGPKRFQIRQDVGRKPPMSLEVKKRPGMKSLEFLTELSISVFPAVNLYVPVIF